MLLFCSVLWFYREIRRAHTDSLHRGWRGVEWSRASFHSDIWYVILSRVHEKPEQWATVQVLGFPLSVLITLSFAQDHLPSAWKSANIFALHKKVQKPIPAITDQSVFSQSSASLRNQSSLQILNSSSSPMVWFLTTNLELDQVTQPWTCYFCIRMVE